MGSGVRAEQHIIHSEHDFFFAFSNRLRDAHVDSNGRANELTDGRLTTAFQIRPKLYTRIFVLLWPLPSKYLINQTHHHRRVFCHIYLYRTYFQLGTHYMAHTRSSIETNGVAGGGGERQTGACDVKICCWCGAYVINDLAYAVLGI